MRGPCYHATRNTHHDFSINTPVRDLTPAQYDLVLYGENLGHSWKYRNRFGQVREHREGFEGVVPRMRDEKQRRQFIFSTHNANIPVLGDAELILGLAFAGEGKAGHAKIAPERMGSIDSKPVRELVEEILEGGKDAFEMRRSKYGF